MGEVELAKGGAGEPTSLTYAEALQAALAFGWIDWPDATA